MATNDMKIVVATEENHVEMKDFLVSHFSKDCPLTIMLPVAVEEEQFLYTEMTKANFSLIGNLKGEMVGCKIGNIFTYEELKSEEKERTAMAAAELDGNALKFVEFVTFLSQVDLSKFGINAKTVIYESFALSIDPAQRGQRLGTKITQESLVHAKNAGAEFYFVQTVSSFAAAIFRKLGFISVRQMNFEEYFKSSPEIVKRILPNHPGADFMIKKLD